MRTFCHISEFGLKGYDLLPVSLLSTDKLVYWAPSSEQLRVLYNDGNTYLTDQNLLELIDNNELQIIGRENWIFDKNGRNKHPWTLARWNATFDEKIKALAIEDEHKSLEEKRVIVAKPETGFDSANEFVDKNENEQVVNELLEYIQNGNLPDGSKEKIISRKIEKPMDQLKLVLQDIYNHIDAKKECEAEFSLEPDDCTDFFIAKLHPVDTRAPNIESNISGERIADVIHQIKAIEKIDSFKKLKNVIKEKEQLKSEIIKLTRVDTPISHLLKDDLSNHLYPPSWSKAVKPTKLDYWTIGMLLASVVSFEFSVLNLSLLLGDACFDFTSEGTIVRRSLEKQNLLKKKRHFNKLPLLLAYGRDKVTYKEAQALYDQLS